MRLLLCGPDAWEVLEAIGYVFELNGDQVFFCDHGHEREERRALAEKFAPHVAIFYLPLDPGEELDEADLLRNWGTPLVCLMTDPRSQGWRASRMGAARTLQAPFELDALEQAVYAAKPELRV
ncbi:MAG: response regulator [Deltaproteobacteria bacterium]